MFEHQIAQQFKPGDRMYLVMGTFVIFDQYFKNFEQTAKRVTSGVVNHISEVFQALTTRSYISMMAELRKWLTGSELETSYFYVIDKKK